MRNEVVIRRPLWGKLLFILMCAMLVFFSILRLQDGDKVIGLGGIALFGGGGLIAVIFVIWKPIVVMSNEGITIPYRWKENFVSWRNIKKFEVLEQRIGMMKQSYIGIFVFDTEEFAVAGKFSKTITQKITNWREVPDFLIQCNFSFIKIEKVMGILQEFYDAYKGIRSRPTE